MIVSIKKGKPRGKIVAPPSKSYAHRALICAALSGGSIVSNLSFSEDILATLSCLEALGFLFKKEESSVTFLGKKDVTGVPVLNCNASGSTLRFMIPIALIHTKEFKVTGIPRLLERGIDIYKEICDLQGIKVEFEEYFVHFTGSLEPDKFVIPGNVSSQFITGLLLALPLLKDDSEIEVLPPFESKSYVDITLDVMARFGIRVENKDNSYFVKGRWSYQTKDYFVEGDYSNAAFLIAMNHLGGEVVIEGLHPFSIQGDKACIEAFERLAKGYTAIDISNRIDLGPVLICFAALNHGAKLIGTKRLSIKECDRGLAMKEELEKIGGNIVVKEDEIDVSPLLIKDKSCVFSSHNDHRIVMALSLLSMYVPIKIVGAEAVRKSYPDYFEALRGLGMEITYEE